MPPFLQFILRRLFYALVSMLIITMVLYAGVILTPPEARAQLYIPPGKGGERASENFLKTVIANNHLDAPYLIQYGYWVKSLLTGTWGYSPTLREDVLPSLLARTPQTLELTLYSLLLLIPLGLTSGLWAGWRSGRTFDRIFRSLAFLGTSTPPFILAFILLAIFYIKLDWFQPGRIDLILGLDLASQSFHNYTGLLTIDGALNGRWDVVASAFRHLAMPVFTLAVFHWATLGRITRATILGERGKEYLIAARARGVHESRLVWHHALFAIMAPSLTTMTLSAAALVTGVFVVEIIYSLRGVSQVIVAAMTSQPDAPAALGFSVYSVIMVIGLLFILDIIQAVLDPRVREEIVKA